ncbi:MAG: flavodoxin domain-containing protein [Spirochaetales bacterium]|uniref:Flavodoxin domain-containing protein n=1 Tax=Candidatus Thalassospirochaeta sargassi TaxID=3119039 RepID=A0AAJ1ICV4_9SPIO|nr:flavodoxin domain-containing protein [Spirochaetales bacterium]
MSVLLVSPKNKGNTYDVLSYVERNSDADLVVIDQDEKCNLKDYETIVIGSGVYGNNLHKNLREWLVQINGASFHEEVKIYSFITWIGRGKSDKTTLAKIKNLVEDKNLKLEENYKTCFGRMLNIRRRHPNEDDYKDILSWVKSIA